jgi:hypothetical protein
MPLTWDLTKIEDHQRICWVENKDPNKKANFNLHPVTEALIVMSMLTCIPEITEQNYKELARRLVKLELIGVSYLPLKPREVGLSLTAPAPYLDACEGRIEIQKQHNKTRARQENELTFLVEVTKGFRTRNPRPHEVLRHIGLKTNTISKNNRQWGNYLRRIVRDRAKEIMRDEASLIRERE